MPRGFRVTKSAMSFLLRMSRSLNHGPCGDSYDTGASMSRVPAKGQEQKRLGIWGFPKKGVPLTSHKILHNPVVNGAPKKGTPILGNPH